MIVSDDLLDTLHRRIDELKRQVAALQVLLDQKQVRTFPWPMVEDPFYGAGCIQYDQWIFKDAARGKAA